MDTVTMRHTMSIMQLCLFCIRFNSAMLDEQTQSTNCKEELICLATVDLLCISVDKLHGNIMLSGKKRPDKTCMFRKRILETKSMPYGCVETVVFALDCHQDFYLTTSSRGQVELIFRTSIPRVDAPDERIFDVYFTKLGHVWIQPKLHSNMFLHHTDKVLSVKPLDLNERCPEAYFFYFDVILEDQEQQKVNRNIISADNHSNEDIACNPVSHVIRDKANDIVENKKKLVKNTSGIIELPLSKSAEKKASWSILLFGCFSDTRKLAS